MADVATRNRSTNAIPTTRGDQHNAKDACIEAATSGPRDVALREAMRYAHQYAEDGPVKVVELVTVAMLAASQQAAKGEGT